MTTRFLAGAAALTLSATAFGAPAPADAPAIGAPPILDPLSVSVLGPGAEATVLTRRQAAARSMIEAHVFGLLDPAQRSALIAAGEYAPPAAGPSAFVQPEPLGDEGYQVVRRIVSRETFDRLLPVHQRALVSLMEAQAEGLPTPVFCFAPGTPSGDDGVTWTNAETVGPNTPQSQGGWFQGTISVASLITPTANVRVRFVADDATGAVVEAAVDDFAVTAVTCGAPPAACRADYNGQNGVELTDIFNFLSDWFAGNTRADFNQNGSVELTDIFQFLNAWFAGC
jgi:hypothetical protein